MRVKFQDLSAAVSATILAVRQGVNDARAQGCIAEMPKEIQFSVEVIYAKDGLVNLSASTVAGTNTTTTDRPAMSDVTERTGGGSTTVEASHDTTTRSGNTNDTQSGTDTTVQTGSQTQNSAESNINGSTTTKGYL